MENLSATCLIQMYHNVHFGVIRCFSQAAYFFLVLSDDWIECSTGSSFLPHVITVNAGEVHLSRTGGNLCSRVIHCLTDLWLLGYLVEDNGVLSTRAASCVHNIWQWESVKCDTSTS